MKLVQYALLLTALAVSLPVAAEGLSQEAIDGLNTRKLSDKLEKTEQIAATEHEKRAFVLQALLDGKLFYNRKLQRVVYRTSKEDTLYTARDPLTDEELGDFKKRSFKKIVINNKIRSFIRSSLARLKLFDKNKSTRLGAITELLKSVNEESYHMIDQALSQEQDAEVQDKMFIFRNIYKAQYTDNKNDRLQAIAKLTSLDPEVRVILDKLVQNSDPDIAASAAKSLETIESKTSFFKVIEMMFFGLSYSSILILAAIGLAITFGVMGVINMAHGELIMIGAYTTYVVQTVMTDSIDASLFVAIPCAFLVAFMFGVVIHLAVIRNLHGRPLETLLATFGVSLILQQLVRTVFSPLNQSVETPSWMSGSMEINGVLSLTYNRMYIIAFCLVVFLLLMIIINKTTLGLKVRAIAQNRNMACAMGVHSNYVDIFTFGLGSGIAGVAGVALSQVTNVGPNMGQSYIIDSFLVVVLGGVGNLWGILLGGFGLGVVNKLMEPWIGAVLAKVAVLVLVILIIQKRPKGLLSTRTR